MLVDEDPYSGRNKILQPFKIPLTSVLKKMPDSIYKCPDQDISSYMLCVVVVLHTSDFTTKYKLAKAASSAVLPEFWVSNFHNKMLISLFAYYNC